MERGLGQVRPIGRLEVLIAARGHPRGGFRAFRAANTFRINIMKSVDIVRVIRHNDGMRTETAKEGHLMKTVTTDTDMQLTAQEQDMLATEFGLDAEYYTQNNQVWAVGSFGEYGGPECWPIERITTGKIIASEIPEHDFDWESAEAFRGGPFSS